MPAYIPLTQGKTAIVDEEFFEELNKHKWYAVCYQNRNWYAERMDHRKVIKMHRVVLSLAGLSPGAHTDHENRQTLDNRLDNLRPATPQNNNANRGVNRNNKSGYKGVSPCKTTGKWVAQIMFNRKAQRIGRFATAEQAARAYDERAASLFGEFAYLNFPSDAHAMDLIETGS